jgi:hypothetical protein
MAQATADNDTSTGGQVAQAVQTARDVTVEKTQEVTSRISDQVGTRVRDEADTRSTQLGEQLGSVSGALRTTARQLESETGGTPAKVVQSLADRTDDLACYLRDADADRLLGDFERFGRQRPWMIFAAAAGLGIAASRFLKASSTTRTISQGSYDTEGSSSALGQQHTAALPTQTGYGNGNGNGSGLDYSHSLNR